MKRKHRNDSLSAKTVRSTVQSCILFGLVIQIVALSFYAVTLTRQYIKTTGTTVRQVRMSIRHSTDSMSYSKQVMDIYRSLTEDQRSLMGTDGYRELFSEVDTTTKGGTYDILINMLEGTMGFHTDNDDISDIYLGMYDDETSALVYIVDPDKPPNRFMPGDWEKVPRTETERFLSAKDDHEVLYDIGWMKKYGLICTVGVPISYDGELTAFMLADISLDNILAGMGEFSLGMTIVVVFVTALIARMQTKHIKEKLVKPVNMIAEASSNFAAKRIGEKRYFADLDIHTGDEIERLAETMAEMETSLYQYGRDLLEVTKEKERIGTELSLARKIQADMLPNIFPPFPERTDFDIYASMDPAKEVGGDFYDFFLIDDDHLGLVMADVSGKGVPAALFMMMSKILIKNFAMQGLSPAKVLEKTNAVICQNNDEQMFVTVWFGVLELSSGKLTAANAGHEYPMIRKAGGEFGLFNDKHGFVIGGMEDMTYKEYEIQLDKGDTIFLYTDGVPEATNANSEFFGINRLLDSLNSSKAADPMNILRNVRKSVDDFVGDAEQFDDLTMLGLTLL